MKYRNIVLVTTKVAESIVRDVVRGIKDFNIKLVVLNAPIAALINTRYIARELKRRIKEVLDADIVVVPGLSRGSARVIEDAIGKPVIKGTKYAGDIPEFLKLLKNGTEFSPVTPADDIILEHLRHTYSERLNEYLRRAEEVFKVSNLSFYAKPPPLNLFYEVLVTRITNDESIRSIVGKVVKYGYQGIVLGCEAGGCKLSALLSIARKVRDLAPGIVIGIDMECREELLKDVINYVDMLFNVTSADVEKVSHLINDEGVVLTVKPVRSAGRREVVGALEKGYQELLNMGIDKVIINPALLPPLLGLYESLITYYEVREKFSKAPLLMDVSNVYELIDVDTHGVIALLEALAFELGVSSILITEESRKAVGALKEASISREMLYRAFIKKSPPIDIDVDMLYIKEKKYRNVDPPAIRDGRHVVLVSRRIDPILDPKYYVKVYVDHASKMLIVDVFERGSDNLVKRFVGSDALSLGRAVVRSVDITKEHALYLGYELSRAETALMLGKSFIQDAPLITASYNERDENSS